MVTPDELKYRQAMCLDDKITFTKVMMVQWYEYYEGKVYLAFSGGKDSTVLLDIVRKMYPDVPAVFCNTGLEFPEILEFIRSIENVIWLKPKMSFREVLNKYGYPVISKRQAQYIRQARTTKSEVLRRLRLTGVKPNGDFFTNGCYF